jgi:hypothetical protein
MSGSNRPEDIDPAAHLRIASRLPRMTLLSILAIAAALAVTIVWPALSSTGRLTVSPGPVTNPHRLVDTNCAACHGRPFQGAPDARCRACHQVGEHSAALTAATSSRPDLSTRCAHCHKEHHGDRGLVPAEATLCTNCHANVQRLVPGSRQLPVLTLATHPEFSPLGQGQEPSAARSTMKFSHAEHLQAHPGRAHPEALSCPSCHVPAADGALMQPIAFEKHCARCHELVLDGRLLGVHVPHGSPDAALATIRAELSRAYMTPGSNPDAGASLPSPEDLEAEVLDLEQGLYAGKRGCERCHDMTAAPGGPGKSLHAVVPPGIRKQWFPSSKFSHAAHKTTPCRDCHQGAERSTSAADIMIPGVARCRDCHADPGVAARVESPCLGCHGYHAGHAQP